LHRSRKIENVPLKEKLLNIFRKQRDFSIRNVIEFCRVYIAYPGNAIIFYSFCHYTSRARATLQTVRKSKTMLPVSEGKSLVSRKPYNQRNDERISHWKTLGTIFFSDIVSVFNINNEKEKKLIIYFVS